MRIGFSGMAAFHQFFDHMPDLHHAWLISSVTALCCSAAVAIWVLRLLIWLTEPAISSNPVLTRAVASAADWQLAWVFSMAATDELTPLVSRASISLICDVLACVRAQGAHFVGHHRKASALLTRPCRLNGGVERQQVGLPGNLHRSHPGSR